MKKIALTGGIGYIIIFITGIYANFFVLDSLKVPGDEILTFQNVVNNRDSFVTGIAAFIVMVLADLVLTWCLYALFKPYNHTLNKITAWMRGINVVFFGIALFYLFDVLQLISIPKHPTELEIQFLAQEVSNSLISFNKIWLIGLLFFGVHLILLSTLMFKHIKIPRFITVLLMIAGLGYLIDSMLQFTYSDYQSISEVSNAIVVLPGVIGELSLTFWLLFYKVNKNS